MIKKAITSKRSNITFLGTKYQVVPSLTYTYEQSVKPAKNQGYPTATPTLNLDPCCTKKDFL